MDISSLLQVEPSGFIALQNGRHTHSSGQLTPKQSEMIKKKKKKKALQVREKCVTLIFAKSLSKHHVHVHSIAVFLNSIPLQPSKMTGYYH